MRINVIIIHYDFSDGTELSYQEGKLAKDNFTTCVLNFFCWDYLGNHDNDNNRFEPVIDDIVVLKRNGDYIALSSIYNHCDREIRYPHNVSKMLVANSFKWLPDFINYDRSSIKPQWEYWCD